MGKIRPHQGKYGQWNEYAQKRACTLPVIALLVMPKTAPQEAESNHAGQHDHYHRIHGIAGELGIIRAVQHDGGNHDHFYRYCRNCENQRTVRFAKPVCQFLGVTHHRKRR